MASKRHAYMIIAHHRPDLLQALIDAIDDSRNDIFVHIDVRAGADMDPKLFSARRASLTFIERMRVNWGGYTQVEVALRLLEAATQAGEHAYYHLMTGASYPLKTQDEIHAFFDAHQGVEFVMTQMDLSQMGNVRVTRPFNEIGRRPFNEMGRVGFGPLLLVLAIFNRIAMEVQKFAGYDRFKTRGIELKKGLAYWSVTGALARHVISRRNEIEELYGHTVTCDELFMPTTAWASPFRERLLPQGEGMDGIYYSTWEMEEKGEPRPGHCFIQDDLDDLLASSYLFALKFEGPDGPALIEAIKASWRDGSPASESPFPSDASL